MSKDTLRQIAVIVITFATLIVNTLANALPLNGLSTKQISDQFAVYFTPAGYVFSIWGLIYVGLIAFTIFQALPRQKSNPRMRQIGWLYIVSGIANMGWIFAWHYEQFPLTLAAMLPLLGLLITIFLRLDTGKNEMTAAEKWSVRIPFSIYLGWITVATIANITDVLYYLGWNGSPLRPEIWAVIMLAAATLITGVMVYTRRNAAYAMVIVWATIGIAVEQAEVALVPQAAMIVALIVSAMAAGSIVFSLPQLASSKDSLRSRA
jgi:hypothetical protein